MDTKQLIILKVVKSEHENHRLGLLKKEFENLVKGKKFSLLRVEFDDHVVIDFTKSMVPYTEDGHLTQKGRISTWIEKNGYVEKSKEALLLFELTINASGDEHYYRFLTDANGLADNIIEARKEL